MLTYRLSGHSTSDDPKAYRKESEVDSWKSKDPNVRMRGWLEKKGLWSEQKQVALEEKASAELAECVKSAEKAAPPALETMFDDVFAELPWHLREQKEQLLKGPRAKGHGGH
jgi:2-oxoisovalerate dehydrogenase E1 component alpha subunit